MVCVFKCKIRKTISKLSNENLERNLFSQPRAEMSEISTWADCAKEVAVNCVVQTTKVGNTNLSLERKGMGASY